MPWKTASEIGRGRWVTEEEYKNRPQAGVNFTPISEFPKPTLGERASSVGGFLKDLGVETYKHTKNVVAGASDIAERISPLEPIRNVSSGLSSTLKRDKGVSMLDAFNEGVLKSKARETYWEKVTGESLTDPNKWAGVNWDAGRKFIVNAMEAPTLVYSGTARASAIMGKSIIKRIFSRTVSSAPEIGINTALQQGEQGNMDNFGTNLLANTLLMSFISNIGGEIKMPNKKIRADFDEIKKEIPDMSPQDDLDLIASLKSGVKKEEIILNARKIKEGKVKPEEVAQKVNEIVLDTPKKKAIAEISATKDEASISKHLEGIVDKEDIPTLSKILKNVDNTKSVSDIISSYEPVNRNKQMLEELYFADTDAQVKKILKGRADQKVIDEITPALKSIQSEEDIAKILDGYGISYKNIVPEKVDTGIAKETPLVETPKQPTETTSTSTTSPVEKSSVKSDTKTQTPKESPNKSLIEEAKKYPTEEEFLKAQGTPVYRGGDSKIDVSRGGGMGISVSERNIAENFTPPKGGIVDEAILPKNAKVLKDKEIPKELKNDYLQRAKYLEKNAIKLSEKEFNRIQGEVIEKQKKIVDYARNNGFDAVEFPFENEIRIVKPNVLKTKSQLSAIHKEAHAKPKTLNTPKQDLDIKPKTETPKEPKVTKESKYARDIQTRAIEDGLIAKYGDVAEYTPGVRKKQARLSSEVLADKERTKRILRGEEKLPEDIIDTAFAIAVDIEARTTNDFKYGAELVHLLSNSKLATTVSEAGRNLSMTVGRSDNSIMSTIDRITKLRIGEFEKTGKKVSKAVQDIKKDILSRIKKVEPEELKDFIKTNRC